MVALELEALDEGEAGRDAARLGDGDGAVKLHGRRAGETGKLAVDTTVYDEGIVGYSYEPDGS